MASLLYLKHAFNESDEGVAERWAETPTWQYFSGQEYFEHRWPCDPSLLARFRRSLGGEGVEQLLASTINVAVTLKLIAKKQLATVIVDSTVMPKAIDHPTGNMLGTSRYAHTKQLRRMRKAINRRRQGRAHYEFGAKVGTVLTLKSNLHRRCTVI